MPLLGFLISERVVTFTVNRWQWLSFILLHGPTRIPRPRSNLGWSLGLDTNSTTLPSVAPLEQQIQFSVCRVQRALSHMIYVGLAPTGTQVKWVSPREHLPHGTHDPLYMSDGRGINPLPTSSKPLTDSRGWCRSSHGPVPSGPPVTSRCTTVFWDHMVPSCHGWPLGDTVWVIEEPSGNYTYVRFISLSVSQLRFWREVCVS